MFAGFICIGFAVFLKYTEDDIGAGDMGAVIGMVLFTIIMIILLLSLACQPQNKAKLSFKVGHTLFELNFWYWNCFCIDIGFFVPVWIETNLREKRETIVMRHTSLSFTYITFLVFVIS